MLKSIGRYNNFPKGFEQPKLAKGEAALYQLLNSVADPDRPGQFRYNALTKIRSIDTVVINDETVDIGLVKSVTREGDVNEVDYIKIMGQENAGYFRLVGGSINDDKMYAFLELCNENESNPNRDESRIAKFRRIDDLKDAKDTRKKRSDKLAAMTFASNMNLTSVKQFASSRNWDENLEPEVLRSMVEKLAEENPKEFIRLAMDKDIEIKATIKRAIDNKVIEFNLPQSKWVWVKGGETIAQVARVEGIEPFDGLCDFIKTHKNGNTVYEAIAKGTKKQVIEQNQPGTDELEEDTNDQSDTPPVNKGGRPKKVV